VVRSDRSVEGAWAAVMAIHSADPTVQRREERLLRERLAAMDGKVTALLAMAGPEARGIGVAERPSSPPAPTEEDAFYLAEELASMGTDGLPHGSHIETTAIETTTPLQRPYGRTYTTIATSVSIFPLQPMTPAAALLCGLLTCSGRFQPSTYERMVKEIPGVVAGLLRPWHEAARPGRL
jgi:hypothetical protein